MLDNIVDNIEVLQDKLNQMISNNYNSVEVYALSTELDNLITKYYMSK